MWRDGHKHMDMIYGQNPANDLNPQFLTRLQRDLPNPFPDNALQHLETIFRNPNNVIAMMKNSVLAFIILHDL